MAANFPDPSPNTVEEIFQDYSVRYGAVHRALTTDFEEFFNLCDPENEYMCLYGDSDGSWRVSNATDEVPTDLPEPTLGLLVGRDLMKRQDWLSLIALHTDCWLIALAFRFALHFDYKERNRLFNLINEMPTLHNLISLKKQDDNVDKDDDDDNKDDICGSCGEKYNGGEFWIACDMCEVWYHGNCVKVTQAKADKIKKFKCPACVGIERSKRPPRPRGLSIRGSK
ncbi:PHD finger protein ALFIN-LIKE 3-like [Impatiens glandulifera]|uniref:PHD finger protein ALFIN-LIKE 3-like n=1 Tax=Impatiens glandulifera TaxID=253017 RepID=UPI001FB0DFDD|nr:PHD finger protein ALFIN-LIKE 3-like [Impatiens glandulifera]